jgi:hypothetical protein
MQLETRKVNETTASGNTLTGYAVIWDAESRTISEHGRVFTEQIARGAFQNTLNADEDVKLYYNHDTSQPLARTKNGSLRLFTDDKGLRFEADLPDTTLAKDVKELLNRKILTGEMSFGFYNIRDSWSPDKKQRKVNEAKLVEISVVVDAAYPSTSSQLRNAQSEITQKRINLLRRRLK